MTMDTSTSNPLRAHVWRPGHFSAVGHSRSGGVWCNHQSVLQGRMPLVSCENLERSMIVVWIQYISAHPKKDVTINTKESGLLVEAFFERVLICVQGIPLPCVSSCHSKISWWRQGAGACILAFSTTDRDSFDAVESWYKKVPCPWTSIAFLCWMAPNGAFGRDLHWLVIAMLVFAQVHDECGQMAMVLVQNKAGMDFSRLTWQWMILSLVKASAC